MANFEYKNIDEILSTSLPIRGIRVGLDDNGLLEKVSYPFTIDPSDPKLNNFEFHVFLPNGAYIGTVYNLQSWKLDTSIVSNPNVVLDIHRDMRRSSLLPGVYKVVYNFFKDVVGGYSQPVKLFVSDISQDRSELKVSLINPDSTDGKEQLKRFVLKYLNPSDIIQSYVLNFGENKISNIINVTSDGFQESFYVKLYEPLPEDLDIFAECWVSEEFMKPYIETVNYIAEEIPIQIPELKGPNFEVDYDYWTTTETEYKSWNDILSANVQTSQEILDRYISSSNIPVQLNVNYREFENFVFYSSAEDRINNFVYKVELLERYNNELNTLATYTGSIGSNTTKIRGFRDRLISGFDNFEKWLYYETTGSNYYTSQATASIVPYPKYEMSVTSSDYTIATKEGKFKIYTSGSNEVDDWYNRVIDLATDYDLKNYNSLNKAIPEYLREDPDNQQFVTFVNMIGQHFDIMYVYTDHIVKKNLREEHPKDGMSQDLIYDVAKNLGWTLSHGTQTKDLWEYALGVSGSGEPVWTGKTTTNKYLAKSEEERTKEVWRRILNNLPYIYKSKGTGRGVTALLAAYGIPQTLLTIREYGGPDNADIGQIPRAQWEKHTYYLNFSGSYPLPTRQHHVRVPWEKVYNEFNQWQYPDTVTFRWKQEPASLYSYQGDPVQTLLQKQSGSRIDWFVTVDKNGGTDYDKGTLTFYLASGSSYKSASIVDEYLYDDIPLNLMIRRSVSTDLTSSNQTYDFILKTNKYGKIAVERSASITINGSVSGSFNQSWASDGTLYIGSGSNPQTDKILSGSVFELRYWTKQLFEDSFNNHVLAARAYNGNTDTSSFYDLQAQFKFWQKFDVAVTTSISSSHPDQSKTYFSSSAKMATFYNFDEGSFEPIVETYNMEVATLGNNTIYTEKIRIDSGSLVGGLSKDYRAEVSAFDKFSVDSDKLMIAFSPQNVINEDIYESIGGTELDDYIGTYSNISANEYKELKWLAREYWKKYPNRNDFTAYIRLISKFDFSVFDQIRQTLPARSNPILGLVVESNILERNKVDGAGRIFTGTTNYTFDSNEISSSATIYQKYDSNTATIVVGDSQEGEVQDIADDIDIEPTLPIVVQQKVGLITGSIVDTSVTYNNNKTTVDINVDPYVDYNDKKALIDNLLLDTNVSYTPKNTSIQIPFDTSINYEIKEGTIDEKKLDADVEYSNKESVISDNIPDTNVLLSTNNGNIGSLREDVNIDYNTKRTLINVTEEELNSTYNGIKGQIYEELPKELQSNYNTIQGTTTNINGSTLIKYVVGSFNILQDYANYTINTSTTYDRSNIVPTGSSLNIGYGGGWITQSNDIMKSLSFIETITGSRIDNFYNSHYLFYTSSAKYDAKDPYSSSLIQSSVQNQHNLATSIRHHRFEGSKLIGPDINVNSDGTLDGTPVVEVYIVDSKEIVYRTYTDGGNLSAI
jgi:hypothetical protein